MGRRESLRRFADRHQELHRWAKRRVKEERKSCEAAERQIRAAAKAQEIVQAIAVGVQERVHKQIAELVTRCLRTVFQQDLSFQIAFEKKRGKTEARFVFLENGEEMDPREGSAGGAIDVAAFGLRLACLLLQRPTRRRLLIMDEPFKNINGEANQERAGALVEALSEETGVQFIIVTDDDWLKVGKVIKIG